MAPQIEEVIVNTDLLHTQQFSPDTSQHFLNFISRRNILVAQFWSRIEHYLFRLAADFLDHLRLRQLRDDRSEIPGRDRHLREVAGENPIKNGESLSH